MFQEKNREELETRGFTVVHNVLSKEECDCYIKEYRDWLLQFKDWPYSKHSLIQRYNVGHLSATWNVRIRSKDVFAILWKTKKLLSSFDAISIGRPPENGEENFQVPGEHWIHVDQRDERFGLHAYQGGVYLEEVEEDDWTFLVVCRSHLYLDEFYQTQSKNGFKNNTLEISQQGISWFKSKGCEMLRVGVPKGGMVLWDSRLLHANARPIKGRRNPGRWRYVVFVSMTPAIWATEEDIKNKRKAYNEAAMTVHWSSQGIKRFATDIPENYSDDIMIPTTVPVVAQTVEAKQLSGVLPYDFNNGEPNGPSWKPTWRKLSRNLDYLLSWIFLFGGISFAVWEARN